MKVFCNSLYNKELNRPLSFRFFPWIAVSLLVFVACGEIPGQDEGDFYVRNYTTGAYYKVFAVPLYEDETCIIYAESSRDGNPLNGVNELIAKTIGETYRDKVEPSITAAFGEITHVTAPDKQGYGKVTLLLTDIKDGFTGSDGYVAGAFSPVDMFTGPRSNGRDMLYIDTNPGLNYATGLYATMAHELQHLINFSNTAMKNGGRELDLWINEGLSTAAEYIYGGDPSYRVSYYNSDPGDTIAYGNNFFVWEGAWDHDALADYATAYLFFQWLRLHASNGQGIYKEIIANAAVYTDYRAVSRAVKNRLPSALGLSSETAWEPVIRSWYLANFIQASNGIYGYNGKIATITKGQETGLTPTVFTNTKKGDEIFYPGEGIVSKISSPTYAPPTTDSGVHIKYVGFSSDGTVVTISPNYTGDYLLTFNANTDTTGLSEKGYLASVASQPGSAAARSLSMARTARPSPLPRIYPIDARVLLERNKRQNNE